MSIVSYTITDTDHPWATGDRAGGIDRTVFRITILSLFPLLSRALCMQARSYAVLHVRKHCDRGDRV